MFTDDELIIVKNCLEYRRETIQERIDTFSGCGNVLEIYESELKQINDILNNIATGVYNGIN